MNNMRILFLAICAIACLLPTYGQKDTITAEGIFPKYNHLVYRPKDLSKHTIKIVKDGEIKESSTDPNMELIRGELDRATKAIGLTYKRLPQYIISETFGLEFPPVNPKELHMTANNAITSQWIHEDGECILFINCPGMKSKIDKSITQLPKELFYWIKQALGMGSFLIYPTEEEMKKINKEITCWSPRKSKKVFNAQYVITYPIKNEKSIYMDLYMHKMDLTMIKWGERLTVSFLVTKKGNKNIKKYIKDVEDAFWFED